MSTNWTKEQSDAIYAPVGKYNILVSADAGSGKTAVLVERICNMIINMGISVENLLVVTFTNAAAAGMKSRIIERLHNSLGELELPEEKSRVKNQINLCATADIMTIDAFCLNVLKNNFHLAGISPNFYIMDKTEEELIKQTAFEELFAELYRSTNAEEKQRFYTLIEAFADNRSDDRLIETISNIHRFAQSFAEPMEWVKNASSYYNTDIENGKWFNNIYLPLVYKKDVLEALEYIQQLYADFCEQEKDKELCEKIEAIILYMQKLLECKNIREIFDLKKDIPDFAKSSKKVAVYDTILETFAKLEESLPYTSIEEIEDAIGTDRMSYIAECLAWIVQKYDNYLESEKERRNTWTFSDIEHKVYNLLKDNDLSLNKAYSQKYTEILIDEYQDTNGLQDSIFKSISRDNKNIFMVGDLKQSIYRFRGGDMSIFRDKFINYEYNPKSDDILGRLIILSNNFRSSNEVLRGVDAQFEKLMTEALGDVEYRCNQYDDEKNIPEFVTEVKPIACIKGEEEDARSHAEARYIAQRIKAMVGTSIRISQTEEKVIEYGDFAILLRAVKGHAAAYTEEFKKAGIPLRVALMDFFDKREVKVVISLLSALSNVKQDIPLVSLLMSPIFGFSGNELAKIKCEAKRLNASRGLSLYDTLLYVSQNSFEDNIKSRCAEVLDTISRWRSYTRIMSVAKLIWTIYEESGFYDYMGAIDGNEESQRNLRLLYERALGFERNGSRGLFDFVRYLENLRAGSEELSGAKSASGDSVAMMTIHASKGLEFPFVFIAGLGQKLKISSAYSKVIMNKDIGLGIPCSYPEKQTYGVNIYTEAVRHINDKEEMSEYVRLLYVAATRAKHKLINVVAFDVKNEEEAAKSMQEWKAYIFNDYINSRVKYFKDWVVPAAIFSPDIQLLDLDIYCGEEAEDVEEEIYDEKPSPEMIDSIKKLLDFEYKYKNSTDIPSRTSATELKRAQSIRQKNQHSIKKGLSALGDNMDGAKRGTAYHNAISFINLDTLRENLCIDTVRQQIEVLVDEGKINRTIYEKDSQMPEKIYTFFAKSHLGKRILEIDNAKIYREKNFQLAIDAKYYKPNSDVQDGEEIILQGVIDCFYIDEENDSIVLLDYKTDSMKNKTKQDMLNIYGIQLDLYTEAIEKVTGKTVTHKYLYLFDIDEAVEYKA